MIKEIHLPVISENVESGDIINILVSVGDFVQEQQPIIEIETEKATFDMPAPVSGKVVEIDVASGQNIKVGELLLKLDTEAEPQSQPASPKTQQELTEQIEQPIEIVKTQPPDQKSVIQAAPSTRRLARELGVDIAKVPPGGSDLHISVDDVKKYAKKIIINEYRTIYTPCPGVRISAILCIIVKS